MNTEHISDTINPLIHKNYTIHTKIGEGGCSYIYKAVQKSTGQTVALKTIKFVDGVDEQTRKQQVARFEREIQLCAEINHPNIVRILDRDYTVSNEPFVVFEYLKGDTLKDLLLKENGLSATDTANLMGQVLDALVCIHAKGIVHRDLKPQNIIVAKTGARSFIKILDFGIGTYTPSFQHNDYKTLTINEQVVGTPAYSAPEQLRGEPSTEKTDIYTWGLIFLECLTGIPVMKGNSVADIFHLQLNANNITLPHAIASHPLGDLLKIVLQKKPNDRVYNAQQLFDEFSKINFQTIVGKISHHQHYSPINEDYTADNYLSLSNAKQEKRQITALCAKLSISLPSTSQFDIETLDAIQEDQIRLYSDIALKYGGYISQSVADHIVVYFGYPNGTENDARRVGRTALELVSQVQKRSSLLYAQYNIKLNIRIGINTGTVLIKPNILPEGTVTNIAFELLYNAENGSILASKTTKKLLNPYIEFKVAKDLSLSNMSQPLQSFLMIGEYQTEAFAFLNPQNAEKKLIGREIEQKRILDLWNNKENLKAIIISGQAGIGKSKLLFEIKKQVITENAKVIECRCLPEHQNNALYPFFEILKRQWAIKNTADPAIILKELTASGCNIDDAMPIICSWLSIPQGDKYQQSKLSPENQKTILFETLTKCILQSQESTQVLFIIEDLHWGDSMSIELMHYFIKVINNAKTLIIGSSRSEFKPEWEIETIQLQSLEKTCTKEIVEGILSSANVEDKLVDYIAQKSDGVPLYIEEFTSMLKENNFLTLNNEVYSINTHLQEKPVPETLHALLNTRLDKTSFAKETAQLASVIGREFSYDLLVKASSKEEFAVQADLESLINADIIYHKRHVDQKSYIFRHALICDAAYEGMINITKKEKHIKIAEAIEAHIASNINNISEQQFEIIATHKYKGGKIIDGIIWLNKALLAIKQKSANKETQIIAYKALEWIQQISKTKQTQELEISIRQALIFATMAIDGYGANEVGKQLEALRILCKALGDTDNLFSTMTTQVNYYMMHNNWKLATDAALFFHEEALKQKNTKWIIASSVTLGQQYFTDGRFEESAQLLESAIKIYSPEIDQQFQFGIDQGILAASILCSTYHFLGRSNEIPELEAKAMKWAEEAKHVHSSASLYFGLSCLYIYKNDKETLKKHTNKLTHMDSANEPNMFIYMGKTLALWADSDLGSIKKIIAEQEACNMISMKSFWYAIIAKLEIEFENFDAAKERINKALSWIGNIDGHLYSAELHHLLGISYWGLKNKDLSIRHLEEARNIAQKQKAVATLLKIEKVLDSILN